MRVLIRTSKWAIWARRFGSFAVPLTVVPLLLHREGLIESKDFVVIELVAAAFAVIAIICGLGALGRLWMTGDRGWGKAAWGIAFGLICLAPFGYLGYLALHYPQVSEVTTDWADALPLASPVNVKPTSDAQRQAIALRFPNARSRSYPIDATQMFQIVSDLADDFGWDVRTERQPDGDGGDQVLTAVAMTPFGWRDAVAVRVRGTAAGSEVDMRSVPLVDFPDFGEDGRRIESFLLAIDQKVTLLLRNAPQTATTPDSSDDTDPPIPATRN